MKIAILKVIVEQATLPVLSSSDVVMYLENKGIFAKPAAVRTNLVRYSRHGLLSREWDVESRRYLYGPNHRTRKVIAYFEKDEDDYDDDGDHDNDTKHYRRSKMDNDTLQMPMLLKQMQSQNLDLEPTFAMPDITVVCEYCGKEFEFGRNKNNFKSFKLRTRNGILHLILYTDHRC